MCQRWLMLKYINIIVSYSTILHLHIASSKKIHQRAQILFIICAICLTFSLYKEHWKTKQISKYSSLLSILWLESHDFKENIVPPCCDRIIISVPKQSSVPLYFICSPVPLCFCLGLHAELFS